MSYGGVTALNFNTLINLFHLEVELFSIIAEE